MKLFTKIKKTIKLLLKKEYPFKVQTNTQKKWMGNEYGGFYVAPKSLNKNSIIYSIGIGEDISFDLDLITQFGCTIQGFDPTPKSIQWLKKNQPHSNFIFHEYGIDTKDGETTFFLPKNPNLISGALHKTNNAGAETITVPVKKITTICKELGHKHIDLLKMDIEGAEYSVIPDILSSKISIHQILIEFHHRFIDDGFKKNKEIIRMLNGNDYKIFAVSDSLMEISFIKTK
jgi:FkbM family methyltransferase